MSSQPLRLSFSCFSCSKSLVLFLLALLCSFLIFFFCSVSLVLHFPHLPPLSFSFSFLCVTASVPLSCSFSHFTHLLLCPMLHWGALENRYLYQELSFDLCWLWLFCHQSSEVLVGTRGEVEPNSPPHQAEC